MLNGVSDYKLISSNEKLWFNFGGSYRSMELEIYVVKHNWLEINQWIYMKEYFGMFRNGNVFPWENQVNVYKKILFN